jgi:short-subunit dehydrogenase
MPMPGQPKPKAIVTGASSGLGRVFAKRLAAQGYDVVITARRQDLLEDLAQELNEKHGAHVEVVACDLAASEGRQRVSSFFDQPDTTLLINNAGYGKAGALADMDVAHLSGQVMLNATAVTELTYAAVQAFLRRGEGQILNISSLAGFMPVPGLAVYAATKAYVRNFSLAVAEELRGTGVHVSVLCPGYTDTGFFDVAGMDDRLKSKSMSPEDVVDFALARFAARDPLIVPGISNQMLTTFGQHLPLSLVARVAGFMFRRQAGKG